MRTVRTLDSGCPFPPVVFMVVKLGKMLRFLPAEASRST